MVLVVAFVIVLALMYFIIPTFAEVLSDMSDGKAGLPWLTQKLLNISHWLKGRKGMNILIVLSIPMVIFAVIKLIKQFRCSNALAYLVVKAGCHFFHQVVTFRMDG